MKRKLLVMLLLVLLVPFGSAEVTVDNDEDFESYAPGTSDPTPSWANPWTGVNRAITVRANGFGDPSGSQSLEYKPSSSTNSLAFNLGPDSQLAYSHVEMWSHPGTGSSASVSLDLTLNGVGGMLSEQIRHFETGRVTYDGVEILAASGCAATKPVNIEFTGIDWGDSTFTLRLTNAAGTLCHSSSRPFSSPVTAVRQITMGRADPAISAAYLDGFVFSGVLGDPPDGLDATTYADGVVVRVELETGDADDTGSLDYILQRDDGSGFATIATLPAGTAEGRVFTYGDSAASGSVEYRAFVEDIYNLPSCRVAIDASTPGSSDTCGGFGALPGGGRAFGNQGWVYGGDKSAFADAWKLTENGLDLLYGTIIIIFFMGAAFKTSGGSTGAALAGAFAGVFLSFTFGLYSLWMVVFIVVVGAGAMFLRRSIGGGAMDG